MPVQSKQPCTIVKDSNADDAESMIPSCRIINPPLAEIRTTSSCHSMVEPISPEVHTEGSPSNVDESPKVLSVNVQIQIIFSITAYFPSGFSVADYIISITLIVMLLTCMPALQK